MLLKCVHLAPKCVVLLQEMLHTWAIAMRGRASRLAEGCEASVNETCPMTQFPTPNSVTRSHSHSWKKCFLQLTDSQGKLKESSLWWAHYKTMIWKMEEGQVCSMYLGHQKTGDEYTERNLAENHRSISWELPSSLHPHHKCCHSNAHELFLFQPIYKASLSYQKP